MEWDYIFLDFDPRTTIDDRIAVADTAVDMFLKEEKTRDIDTGTCAARVYTKGEYRCAAGFAGKVYYADIDTNLGPTKHAILVCKEPPSWMDQDPDLN